MTGIPVACTLQPSAFKTRLVELAELNRIALLSGRRENLTLHLHYRLDAEQQVKQMIAKERECCPFFTFDLQINEHEIRLRIMAPENARQGIENIFAPFLP